MKCWKCGEHMSRSGGWATCDSCGRTVQYGRLKNRDYSGEGGIAAAGAIIGAAWLSSRGGTRRPLVGVRFVASLVGLVLIAAACYLGYIAVADMLFENLGSFLFLAFSACLLLWATMLTFMAGYGSVADSFRDFCLLMVGIILDIVLKAGGAATWCFDVSGYISTNPVTIILQRHGFSREAATYIKDNHPEWVIPQRGGTIKLRRDALECANENTRVEANQVQFNSSDLFELAEL